MTSIYFYYGGWMKWKLLLGLCRDERSSSVWPVGGHGSAASCSRLSNDCRFVAAWCLSSSHTEGERARERERVQAARCYRPYWEFYLWYRSHPAEVQQTNQKGAGWLHTHTHARVHAHTYIHNTCPDTDPHQGWHLQLSAAMAGYLCWEGWWWGEFSRWLHYTVYQTDAVALSLHEPAYTPSLPRTSVFQSSFSGHVPSVSPSSLLLVLWNASWLLFSLPFFYHRCTPAIWVLVGHS